MNELIYNWQVTIYFRHYSKFHTILFPPLERFPSRIANRRLIIFNFLEGRERETLKWVNIKELQAAPCFQVLQEPHVGLYSSLKVRQSRNGVSNGL